MSEIGGLSQRAKLALLTETAAMLAPHLRTIFFLWSVLALTTANVALYQFDDGRTFAGWISVITAVGAIGYAVAALKRWRRCLALGGPS